MSDPTPELQHNAGWLVTVFKEAVMAARRRRADAALAHHVATLDPQHHCPQCDGPATDRRPTDGPEDPA